MIARLGPFALSLALVACGRGEERDPVADASSSAVEPAPPARAEAPPKPAPPKPAEPVASGPVELTPIPGGDASGPAYFVINTKGVARLDETGVALILDKPERNLSDLFVGPDGAVYLVDARSLRKIEGDAISEVLRFDYDDVAPVDRLAVAPDGSVWVTSSRGVGRHDGRGWTITPRAELGLGYSSDVAVGFDGVAWLAGSTTLLRRGPADEVWARVDTAKLGRALLILHMTASPAGFVVATNGQQLLRLGSELEPVPLPGAEGVGYTADLSIAADGTIALAGGTCDLIRLGPDGRGGASAWKLGRHRYACETLEAMAIDARSRIWVASREGLSVIAADKAVVELPAGSFAALAGRVSHVAVVGRGPELPEPGPVATTTLTGTIVVEDSPLGQAKLEACPTVRLLPDGSPCSKAGRRYAATTDARGRFRLDDVAIGDLSFAVEIEGIWRWTSPPSFAAQLRAGEVHELGELTLAKR